MILDIKSLYNVLSAIKGKLIITKIKVFYLMLDLLKFSRVNLDKLPLNTSPSSSNAWLAEFIYGKGYFVIKGFSSNPKTPPHLGIQFQLSQRNTDKSGESLEKIMLKITPPPRIFISKTK